MQQLQPHILHFSSLQQSSTAEINENQSEVHKNVCLKATGNSMASTTETTLTMPCQRCIKLVYQIKNM